MSLPAPVLAVLQGLCAKPIPNECNTAAQGSARMVPGAWPHAALAAEMALPVEAPEQFERFVMEEEQWRNLSLGGPPEKVALDYLTGAQIVNASGKPVPVTLADDLHFTLTQHLGIAVIQHDVLAQAQVSALMDWLVAWAKKDLPKQDNARGLGWCLEATARVGAANKLAGIQDDRPLMVAKAIVARVKALHGEQNGMPYLALNQNLATSAADHGYCRNSRWMSGRIVVGLAMWLDQAPWWSGIPLTWWSTVRGLYLHGLKADRWVMKQSEKLGAPLGGCADDADPWSMAQIAPGTAGLTYMIQGPNGLGPQESPRLFVHQKDGKPLWDGTMIPFAIPALLTAKKHAPQMWEGFFRPRVEAWWSRSDRMKWGPKMGHHEASVALSLLPIVGYKT